MRRWTLLDYIRYLIHTSLIRLGVMMFNATFNNIFSSIVAVSFIGGRNRRTRKKMPTCRKSLTNYHIIFYQATSLIGFHQYTQRTWDNKYQKQLFLVSCFRHFTRIWHQWSSFCQMPDSTTKRWHQCCHFKLSTPWYKLNWSLVLFFTSHTLHPNVHFVFRLFTTSAHN